MKAATKTKAEPALSEEESKLLQACLTIFQSTLSLPEAQLSAAIQNVKGSLYEKDYQRAFGTELNCKAYCARWIPSRALIYRRLLSELEFPPEQISQRQWILLGGGPGSEMLALASLAASTLHTVAIDSADWSACHQDYLEHYETAQSQLKITADLRQLDVLDATAFAQTLSALPVHEGPRFFTLFFTLHELLLASRAKTVAMLRQLTDACRPGDHLLVVESASLGTVSLGEREYSLTWLLEHLLSGDWQQDETMRKDKEWYRLPTEAALKVYPLKLENSRVLTRLFKRV